MKHLLVNRMTFNGLADEIHADNVRAGWWSDIATGESILATRNRGELLMLVVSELSEACEGAASDLFDDKLPHRKMIEVELADAKIRILDAAGADKLDLDGAIEDVIAIGGVPYLQVMFGNPHAAIPACLMQIVNQVSRAMESHRKRCAPDRLLSNRSGYEVGLATALLLIQDLGARLDLNVAFAMAEKRAFNAQRDDHKIDSRRAAGGKQY